MEGQILVVDGTATNRIKLKVRLAAACYDPLTARTGAEALAVLARCRPGIVLIGGPPGDMGAIELCARITAEAPGLPVVVAVPQQQRIAALQSGAAAVLDMPLDEGGLFARIRGLMRDRDWGEVVAHRPGMAEEQQAFQPARSAASPSVLLIAGDAGAAMGWRHALAPRLVAQLRLADPERALAEAAVGLVPDLYLIAADMAQPGDGLRLLSELRSRRSSRDAAFAMVLEPQRRDMMSVALDLGAGDVLLSTLAAGEMADEAALRLSTLIRRKLSADGRRAAEERERSLAWIDPLTGLPNRRYALPRLVDLCRHDENECTVVAIDIDRFKEVNDRFGHAAGDAVLAEVAARLERVVPAPGFVARVGGEEFLAVLPDLSETEAAALTMRMRARVSGVPILLPEREDGPGLRITISAGVAGLRRGGQNAQARAAALMAQADDALLLAKRSGRDRLMISGVDAAA